MDKKLLLALSAGLAVSLSGTPIANADTNPFQAQLIDSSSLANQTNKDSSGSCGALNDNSSDPKSSNINKQ